VADLAVTEERFDFSWRGQARRWSHDDDVMTNKAELAGANLLPWVEMMLVIAQSVTACGSLVLRSVYPAFVGDETLYVIGHVKEQC